MKSGAPRDRTSRLHAAVAGAAMIALAGGALLIVATSGVAHATPLLAPAAATPTLDPLIVPTSAASGQAISTPAISTGSGGVELAVTLSCITSVVGLILVALTLTGLIRSGYGPFLRALLPRWLRRKVPGPAEQPVLSYKRGPNNPQTGFDLYAESPSPRGGGRAQRDEWQDRGGAFQRQQRSGQSGRNSSRSSRSRY